ncbi:MAG: hypothetical protein AB7Q81_08390 [Gammaproteobacteria bacterium]
MNEPLTQMTAGAPLTSDAGLAGESVQHDARRAADHGLDTGARGWRWKLPRQGVRQMQAGERAVPESLQRAPK